MDWNNDGKKDLISGDCHGNIWTFINIGSDKSPELARGVRVKADGKPINGKYTPVQMVKITVQE